MLFDIGEPKTEIKAETKAQAKERTKKEWADLRASVQAYLRTHENRETLETFRIQMTALFEAMCEGQHKFSRRPNISLRLITDSDPPGKVIVLPRFLKGYREELGHLHNCNQTIELLEETSLKIKDQEGKQFQKRLDVDNCLMKSPEVGAIYRSAMTDAQRIVSTIRDFLDDRRAVLARNCNHCCICGRGLTDELSRSRGIGPECIKSTNIVAILVGEGRPDPTFIVPEPA